MKKYSIYILTFLLLNGCTSWEKLSRIGKTPNFSQIDVPPNPDELSKDDETLKERVKVQKQRARTKNSLWQPGGITFFRDNRAWRVGDILTVVIEISDQAKLDNASEHDRNGSDSLGMPGFFGKEQTITKTLKAVPSSLISASSKRQYKGSGNISRQEDVKTEIAALVVQILPNGNLVLQGKQEVRVNYELREITVAGIVRPRDITSNNSVNLNQIAEARISYGGRGIVSDVQQPRVGSQILDLMSPF